MHAIADCPVEHTKSIGLILVNWPTKHNPTDFAAPNRLSLFASLSAPWNPNLTYHIDNTYGHKILLLKIEIFSGSGRVLGPS